MVRRRVRIRFCKQGDLRLIGHRDLARTWERLFRRAGIGLRMSQGFHPKPRMSFPSALGVGIAGTDEVLEAELLDELTPAQLAAALAPQLPEGLVITSVELLPAGAPTAQVQRVTFELPIPAQRQPGLVERIARFQGKGSYTVARGEGRKPVDLRALVEDLVLEGGTLRMHIRVTRQGTARPREVLESLGLEDLEQQGLYLTRSAVQLQA